MTVELARFTAAIPGRARQYAPYILASADSVISPFLIYGIGSRESAWGATLKKDTGDWTPRLWSHDHMSKFPHVNVVGQKNGLFLVMPVDGLGWGRGLLQLDFAAEYDWLMAHDWRNPAVSIPHSVEHLRTKYAFFNSTAPATGISDGKLVTVSSKFAARYSTVERKLVPGTYKDTRPFTGGVLEAAAVAGYNAAKENVLAAITSGGMAAVDVCTTEKNYSIDVRGRAARLRMRYDAA